ncbi:ribosomal protein-like protein S15 [Amniculicola lignicola CBS 123094]|uniref:Ribosomal protein-like protein S15 n=1 Tax=Amniculicola lignicola CBS 123094 TaxID=1392246 RepID=A0A6A5WWJ3_9PLEO|nr:ribosomal protein-like protein S15 [Amniculicola lignicola CBS 123094]
MPPRVPLPVCLRASNPSKSTLNIPFRPFSSTPLAAGPLHRKRNLHDPYYVAQRDAKKNANLSRRADLEAVRIANLGDPVRGIQTPFVQSFGTGVPLEHPPRKKIPKDSVHLNYALTPEALKKSLEASSNLAVPRTEKIARYEPLGRVNYDADVAKHDVKVKETTIDDPEVIKAEHERAVEAITRITALENGSSKDRMRVNRARCIATFGRHNTDQIFPPKAPSLPRVDALTPHPIRPQTNVEATKKRIGPDTGSSEVQIALLTAKIKTLADFLELRGKGDHHNKRNLRLLVHRRQKLLTYLRRKERGGPRWQHCIETLGLTEGTWQGEITL